MYTSPESVLPVHGPVVVSLAANYDESYRRSRMLERVAGPCNQAQLYQNALDDYRGIERRNVAEIYRSGQVTDNSEQVS